MSRLNPDKLHISYTFTPDRESSIYPRRYTLTHSDRTGDLFLTIGEEFNLKQVSGLYTRLMRDEIFAELFWKEDLNLLKINCHVSGGLALGPARWRYNIFQTELPLVIEALRYGDRKFLQKNVASDQVQIQVKFTSTNKKYNKAESWGRLSDYG